jgi:hypothetical protein
VPKGEVGVSDLTGLAGPLLESIESNFFVTIFRISTAGEYVLLNLIMFLLLGEGCFCTTFSEIDYSFNSKLN